MAFIVIVSALFAALAGLAALCVQHYAYGLLLIGCSILIGVAGLEAFR